MRIDIQLYGALREAEPTGRLELDVEAATIGSLRAAVAVHVVDRWPPAARALLPKSAFASERSVLRDGDAVPSDGRLALLPPVSGG